MVMDHIILAFSHQVENNGRNGHQMADAMRQELSETCPEVIWRYQGSLAYSLIQSLCLAVNWDLPDSLSMFLDAVTKVNREMCTMAEAK